MVSSISKKLNRKQKITRELRLYLTYALLLSVFLGILTTYRRLILAEYSISYTHYGYAFIEALILAKIILIGKFLGLGERYSNQPLFFSILYKTIIFSLLVVVFNIGEHFVSGLFDHQSLEIIWYQLIHKEIYTAIASFLLVSFSFFFFFAFLEMGRIFGNKELFQVFFIERKALKKASSKSFT